MKKITKKAFTEYLTNLPPDKPFCKGNNCPLMQFYSDSHPDLPSIKVGANAYGTSDKRAVRSPRWMNGFVDMVDSRRAGFWEAVTPEQCMEDLRNAKHYY